MAAAEAGGAAPVAAPEDRVPTIVVDGLHVVYRVWGAKRTRQRHDTGTGSAMGRLMGGRRKQGVREVHALKGVSFATYRGDAVGLVGSNGSGKSTLLRAIAGLLPATRGAVYTDAQPSLLGVNAALMNQLTGERNIELGCLAMGMSPDEVEEKFDSIVEFSGIGDFVNLPMSTYSSGMAARLRFAIASAVTHDVLLIDEALATGDAEFRRRSEARIRELRDQAGTVFLVSHSLDVVRDTCNRAIWLDEGAVRMDGDAGPVLNAYEVFAKEVRTRRKAEIKARRRSLRAALGGGAADGGSSAPDSGT
ncbi:MAG: ABC transporter ATP-binding protein [Candidatus Nanopelagicales bacterium]